MAARPSQIPAGGRDKISVVVRTDNLGGSILQKRFTVSSDDPRNPTVELLVSGKVEAYVTVEPRYAMLIGTAGHPISASLTIVPQPRFPFKIKSVRAVQGEHIAVAFRPLGRHPERDGYEVVVTDKTGLPGNYRDYIVVETDLAAKPTIRIAVGGRVMPAAEEGAPAK